MEKFQIVLTNFVNSAESAEKLQNLVMTLGYGEPAICVDVHVHRIFNRLGYIKTKTPEETEFALREKATD